MPDDIETREDLEDMVDDIVLWFNEHGYAVSPEAVGHNLSAWWGDMKSGYRDEKNGYHLFSPCGCNPLSVRLTTLDKLCEDWQTTYSC
jgi:hypothetical protein